MSNKMKTDLIIILNDFLHGRPSQVEITQDLLIQAKNHEVEGIVYHQTKSPQLQQKYYYSVYNYQQRLQADKKIRQILPYSFTVKGLHIAKFYPVPYLRSCGDIDIVVPQEKKEEAAIILEQNGFVMTGVPISKEEWKFEQNGLGYELHHALLYGKHVDERKYQGYFNSCWEHVNNGELDWNFHFLYIFIHFRRHFMNNGVGFRHFLDLAVLSENKSIDWEYIQRELNGLGLMSFAKTCYTLIEEWFDIHSPIGTVELEESFKELAKDKIMANGVFGFNDGSNRNVGLINNIIQGEHNLFLRKFIATLSVAFPKYRMMCANPNYSILNHRPYLLPVMWVYRWIYCIYTAPWRGKALFEAIYNDDKKQNQIEYLKKWNVIERR